MWGRICAAAVLAFVAACGAAEPTSADTVTVVQPVVLSEMPHDTTAWTQGLEFDGPALYEGTGRVGYSQLRQLDPATGAVIRSAATPHDYYGEGITVVGDRIWELTWRDNVAVEWDKQTLTPVREVLVAGEGWGLCADGDRLIRSDGTDRLTFHEPQNLDEIGGVNVTRDGQPVPKLNELECVDGQVWANIWMTNEIVRVDPATGRVNAVVDASAIAADQQANNEKVLNGIAHIGGDEYLITGKLWPSMFRVRINAPA